MGKVKDIAGETLCGLYVIEKDGLNKHRDMMWKCRCIKCGKESIKSGRYLRSGRTSCECSRRYVLIEQCTKHGMSNSRIYKEYCNMKTRCFNKNREKYKHYGGRGITICSEWLGEEGFLNFYKWALENGYSDNLTLERVDVDSNYSPNNCCWIPFESQVNNRTNTIRLTHDNETKTFSDWCKQYGVNYFTAYTRYKNGLAFNEIFKRVN